MINVISGCCMIGKMEQNCLIMQNGRREEERDPSGDERSRISCCAGSFVCGFLQLDQECKTGIMVNLHERQPSFY